MRYFVKDDLVRMVANDTGIGRGVTEAVVNSFINNIIFALSENYEVRLRDFGSFELTRRAPRVARNINRNEAMYIPSKMVPKFKAGRALKEAAEQGERYEHKNHN